MSETQQDNHAVIPQGYELKKKKPFYTRWWFWLAALIVVAVIATSVSAGGNGGTGDSGAAGTVEVVYSVESDAKAVSVTYTTLNGGNIGQEQSNNATPPFEKALTVEDSFLQSFTMTAQMDPILDGSAPDGTSITCRITVDGEVVAEQTSTGQYAVVTCNAS